MASNGIDFGALCAPEVTKPSGVRPRTARFLRRLANRVDPRPPVRISFGDGLDYAAGMTRARQMAKDIYRDIGGDRPDLMDGRPS